MRLFLLYDPATGEIMGNMVGLAGCQSSINGVDYPFFDAGPVDALPSLGMPSPQIAYSHEDYYIEPHLIRLMKRPEMSLPKAGISVVADGKSEVTIQSIPIGASCVFDGQTETVTEASIKFSAEHPGEYVMTFSLFPWKDKTVTIEATAP